MTVVTRLDYPQLSQWPRGRRAPASQSPECCFACADSHHSGPSDFTRAVGDRVLGPLVPGSNPQMFAHQARLCTRRSQPDGRT